MSKRKSVTIAALVAASTEAQAAATGGGALPWEAGLGLIVTSMTGPVAYAVSVIGIVIAAGILIFGNDLNAFGRTLIFLVLVASVIVGAANALQTFTGVGATTSNHLMGAIGLFFALTSALTATQELFLRAFRKRDTPSSNVGCCVSEA